MKRDIVRAAAMLTQVGVSMLVPIVICVFIGRWADGFFGTNGILLILFILLGIGAGFRSVYDLTKSFCRDKNDKERRFANPKYYMDDNGENEDD